VGEDQGFLARPEGPCRRYGCRQPSVRRCGDLSVPHGHPLDATIVRGISTAPAPKIRRRQSSHRPFPRWADDKYHAVVDAPGNPVALSLTPGQAADITQAAPLLDEVEPDAFIGDKGCDSDALVEKLEQRGITPVIPPKANRKEPRETDFALYCERNLVERFFNALKQYRGIATRYDKLADTFLTGVLLVCVILWLN
jgi:transposase